MASELLLDGVSQAPNIESVNPKGTVDFNDRRRFVGLYAQSRVPADVQHQPAGRAALEHHA